MRGQATRGRRHHVRHDLLESVLEVVLHNGRTVCDARRLTEIDLIPVDTSYGVALVRAAPGTRSGPRDIADETPAKLADAVATIRAVASEMVKVVDGLAVSRATIDFGVTFSMHSGSLIAAFVDVGQECAFNVSLEWSSTE